MSSTVMTAFNWPAGLRRGLQVARLAAVAVLVAACVTINVYFPAAAAEKAADQIIDAVTGGGGRTSAPPAVEPITRAAPPAAQRVLVATLGRALHALVPAAQAQEAASLDISSPQIRALTDAMNARFGQLQKYFDSGVVGMTQDGLIEVRDASAAPLPERPVVTRLVAEDNRDREALYTELARANGHPEWAADIRKTFARRWVERGARTGWYYQNTSGAWVQK